ncbi:hypothetical protein FT643_08530 [Ketobacter sp. MCCC 1A13808]|uniref:hypothetical protein n=1 Tax=Ketobacter sp. MCCC 1A13808 TaxID=2602738 RepID=UPI0012EBBA11|nr:hypothetical protein [Ketobacter sp. MCCC 1A13808]MVF12189.1 hypothetical protein [Ketobacter sp. MCCC 1A13808]
MIEKRKVSVGNEPLFHFLVLGAVVFVISAWLQDEQAEKQVRLPLETRQQFIERYQKEHGQSPETEALQDFEKNWIKEEVLYKEGLAMGLDQHDPVVRERVIKKMQLLFAGQPELTEPEESELERFLQQHRQRYAESPRYGFLALPASSSAEQDRLLLRALNNGADPAALQLQVQQVEGKNPAYLSAVWGADLVQWLNALSPDQQWRRVALKDRTWLLNYQTHQPEMLPPLKVLRPRLMADWQKQQRIRQIDSQVANLQQNYQVIWSD